MKLLGLLFLISSLQYSAAKVTPGELPPELQACYNTHANVSLVDVVGHSLLWHCESPLDISRSRSLVENPSVKRYLKHLSTILRDLVNGNGGKRQNGAKCRRKEYRTLTLNERNRFHRALNTLKEDTSVHPNKYDVLASLHTGPALRIAHGGPNFLGWHRVYLLLIEKELQSVDRTVCIPYWDSTLDNELPVPGTSYVFSSAFFGGRGVNGPVVDGPFANWETSKGVSLIRNIGSTGQLFSYNAITRILSQSRTSEIVSPNALRRNNLEIQHGGPHNFIGGQMSRLSTAAYDPIFFLHHSFVDYIWELFRTRQRQLGINPEEDYPEDFGGEERPEHAPDKYMGFTDYNITNKQGYSDNLTSTYEYLPTPTCNATNPSCNSRYLICNVRTYRCSPIDLTKTSPSDVYGNESIVVQPPNSEYIQQKRGIQNSFCIDDVCDSRGWVYLAVKVVSRRSPTLLTYDCYPFYNGSIWRNNDIYQSSAYAETNRYTPNRNLKTYDKCDDAINGIGQIFLHSQGLSYRGYYKESVIIDQRLPTSLSVGFVAVKNPRSNPVKALLRAFDGCGRVCRTACRVNGTSDFELCSGVLNIDNLQPQMYSPTIGAATLSTWGYARNSDSPSLEDSNIAMAFYCDYKDKLQWVQSQSRIAVKMPNRNECKIDAECTINISCENAKRYCNGDRHKCRGTCNKYAVCSGGYYWKKRCPYDWSFDIWSFKCTSYLRCQNKRPWHV